MGDMDGFQRPTVSARTSDAGHSTAEARHGDGSYAPVDRQEPGGVHGAEPDGFARTEPGTFGGNWGPGAGEAVEPPPPTSPPRPWWRRAAGALLAVGIAILSYGS